MNIRAFLLLAALASLPFASARGSANQSAGDTSKQKAEQKSNPDAAPMVGTDYKIGPQDVVRIDVWKEPDISRTIPVRPDGKISLPLLNDIQASGLTALQLGNAIREGLTKFLTNPQVTVTVNEINSRRVYITGEVLRAGALPLLPNMTVLQALSSAGGFTQFARLNRIYVLRTENGTQVKHPFDYKKVRDGKNQEQDILLQPGDVIVIP